MKHNFKDNHPSRGYVNWWEVTFKYINKKIERQKAKKEIKIELNESGKI